MRFLKILIAGFLAASCLILLLPIPAYADDYLGMAMVYWMFLLVGPSAGFAFVTFGISMVVVILIESIVVALISQVKFPRALLVSFLANIVSAFCGFISGLCQIWLFRFDTIMFWAEVVLFLSAFFTYLGWRFTRSRKIAITIASTTILGSTLVFLSMYIKSPTGGLVSGMLALPFSFGVTLASEAWIFRAYLPPGKRDRALVIANLYSYALYLVGIPLFASWLGLLNP